MTTTTLSRVAAAPRRSGRGRYLRHALVSPFNLIGPGIVAIVAANLGGWVVLLAGLSLQLVMLFTLPLFSGFRARVDELEAQQERAEAIAARARLMLRVGDDRRRELHQLELLVDRVEDRLGAGSAEGLGWLLAAWVRLATFEKAGRDYFAGTSRQALLNEIDLLSDLAPSTSPRVRRLAARRLTIAQRRLACWERTRDVMESVAHQMAAVRALVELAHESALAPAAVDAAGAEVEALLADLDDDGGPLRELAELSAPDDAVDPRLLALGRTAATSAGSG